MRLTEQHTEVAIIGAGIAGLTAAKVLKEHSLPFQLLEASHRIGGRAYSEQLSNNNWFDLGCSYLHNGIINPFVPLANEMKLSIDSNNGTLFDSNKTHYFSDGKKIELGMPNPFDRAHYNLLKAIQKLEEAGYKVIQTISVVDRQEGARERIENAGFSFEAIVTREDLEQQRNQS